MVELRARAGTLIAAAAITTSFFGGQTLIRHRRQLRILMTAFRLGALLLVTEVLAWFVALVIRG